MSQVHFRSENERIPLIGLKVSTLSSRTTVALASLAETRKARRPSTYFDLVLSTVRYLMRTDVHTFAFSVAANAILSFFPFVLLLMMLIRRVFHSPVMYEVVVQLLRDYLPAGQEFVIRNLNALVGARHQAQLASLAILLVTSTGIFLPLEVALNRIWGFQENRSYLGNQVLSLGQCEIDGVPVARPRNHRGPHRGLSYDEGFRDRREHCDLFPDLLAATQRESTGARGVAHGRSDGPVVRGAEVRLHPGFAATEFRGSVRTVLPFGEPHVLGIPVRTLAADRGAPISAGTPARKVTYSRAALRW